MEEEAAEFIGILDAASRTSISPVTVVEITAVLCSRRIGATRSQAEGIVERLGLGVEPVDLEQKRLAIDALLQFGKGRHPARLNLGDCFSYALAKSLGARLLFKGDDFARTDIVPAWRPSA